MTTDRCARCGKSFKPLDRPYLGNLCASCYYFGVPSADTNTRAVPAGYVTEEECKRRCLEAVAMVLRNEGYTPSEYDKEHVEKWYAEHWGKDD